MERLFEDIMQDALSTGILWSRTEDGYSAHAVILQDGGFTTKIKYDKNKNKIYAEICKIEEDN